MKAILDIENKAQGIVTTISELKSENDVKIEEEIFKIKRSMEKMAQNNVLKHKQKLEEKKAKQIADINIFLEEKKQILNNIYAEKKDIWAEEIFNNIIKVDKL